MSTDAEQIKAQCVFCQISAGKIPALQIHKNAKWMAVAEIKPAALGHLLIFPHEHVAFFQQLPKTISEKFFLDFLPVITAVKKGALTNGVSIVQASGQAAGQQWSHTSFHIIPREEKDKLFSLVAPKPVDTEKCEQISVLMRKYLAQILQTPIANSTQKSADATVAKNAPSPNQSPNQSPSQSPTEKAKTDASVDIQSKPELGKKPDETTKDTPASESQKVVQTENSVTKKDMSAPRQNAAESEDRLLEFLEKNPQFILLIKRDPQKAIEVIQSDKRLIDLFANKDILKMSAQFNGEL